MDQEFSHLTVGPLGPVGTSPSPGDRESRREYYRLLRGFGEKNDAVGIVVLAIGAVFILWGDIPSARLLPWSALLGLVAIITVNTVPPAQAGIVPFVLRHMWNLGSTLLWAALPWLSITALEADHVAWIMVFVVVYGAATDVVFVPQTLDTRLFTLIYLYSASYLVAFGVVGQWGAFLAVAGTVLALVLGGEGWHDVATKLISQRDASDERAMTDELTGFGSREAAVARVEAIIAESAPGTVVHCVFADIDDFKQLNDTYGYEFGDSALREAAAHLASSLPDDWTVARFGGDEFVAIGLHPPELSAILDVPLTLPADRGGFEVVHRLSVGSTSLPVVQASAPTLFREAASALRHAKLLGKHRAVVMTDEQRSADAERSRLAGLLGNALQNREIVAWGQPINDLRTGETVGVELLARWPQDDGSMVMPNDFVPLIEDQGRGPQLGMLMISHGIELLRSFADLGLSRWVSVNLSARHLFHQRLPHEIRGMLQQAGIAPSRLVLEITESQHLPSSPVWKQTAEQLRSLGLGLAIDDFGTGYSSMEQLLSMPFTHLKVDRLITRSIDMPGAFDLAAAMAAMAHGADMLPIAEGIETEHERLAVMRAGFVHGQGYLFSRPVPAADLLRREVSAANAVQKIRGQTAG